MAYVACEGPRHLEAAYQSFITWGNIFGGDEHAPILLTSYHDRFKETPRFKSYSLWAVILPKALHYQSKC